MLIEAEEVWENEEGERDLNEDFINDWEDGPDFPQHDNKEDEDSLVSWLVIFLLRLQSRFYLPDAAVSCIVKFVYAFLVILGTRSEYVARMVKSFPHSLYCLRKHWKIGADFVRFVVCPKCYSVYEKSKCIEKQGVQIISKTCTYRDHPNSRKCCEAQLLKTVYIANGKRLYPHKVYCYQTLMSSLQCLLQRPGFSDSCEHWRSQFQSKNDDILRDIYDGRIFKTWRGDPFYLLHIHMH